jgi:outer membrane receptor for ferrienterochelin and colicin
MAKKLKASHLASVAGAAISLAALQPAHAQSGPSPEPQRVTTSQDDAPVTSADDVVVINGIIYRNRTDETAPVLEYGLDFFQPFEPLTVGDALKRVPSVTFLSDVLESDGVRLRGLDPAYTQILINGEKVPGAGSDSGASAMARTARSSSTVFRRN